MITSFTGIFPFLLFPDSRITAKKCVCLSSQARGGFGWMMWTARELSSPSSTANLPNGEWQTVGMLRTLEWLALHSESRHSPRPGHSRYHIPLSLGLEDCLELPNHGSCTVQHHPQLCCQLALLWFPGDLLSLSFQTTTPKCSVGPVFCLSFPPGFLRVDPGQLNHQYAQLSEDSTRPRDLCYRRSLGYSWMLIWCHRQEQRRRCYGSFALQLSPKFQSFTIHLTSK